MDSSHRTVYVVYNPKAGNQEKASDFRSTLAQHFSSPHWMVDLYEITGQEDVTTLCHEACDAGASLVVSAGGDGTLASVAAALVNRQVPLGILPLGTGNFLARVLDIPLDLDKAIQLLAGEHTIMEIDALKVDDCYFFSNVSVGVSPAIMDETMPTQKKRFGMLAYFWTFIKRSRLFHLHRYKLTIDDHPLWVTASEILVSNTRILEKATLLYGPPDSLNDGQFEVYLARAQTLDDYLKLIWDLFRHPRKPGARLAHWRSHRSIYIESRRSHQLVQGDGEVIAQTPVEVQLVPHAIQVIVPVQTQE